MTSLLYIDAGTGSLLLAAIASGAAGLWFFIRTKFYSFKEWLAKGRRALFPAVSKAGKNAEQ
jgi:hypothetical protein